MARLGPEFETAAGVHCAATLIPGVEGADANPYQGLNASIIEVYRAGPRWDVRVRLVGSRREGGSSAEIVYDSGLAVDFDAADAAARIA